MIFLLLHCRLSLLIWTLNRKKKISKNWLKPCLPRATTMMTQVESVDGPAEFTQQEKQRLYWTLGAAKGCGITESSHSQKRWEILEKINEHLSPHNTFCIVNRDYMLLFIALVSAMENLWHTTIIQRTLWNNINEFKSLIKAQPEEILLLLHTPTVAHVAEF